MLHQLCLARLQHYLKVVVQAIVQYQSMRHLDAMWLHWMLIAVVIVANFWVVEVCYLCDKGKTDISAQVLSQI